MNRLERTRLRNELERDVLRWVTGPDVEVPSLPSVVVELNSEIVRGRKSLLALSRLVERDPLLSARLVRVARSALYGPALGELDIHQAMLRVGLEGIRDLAMALTIEHVFIAKRFARVTFESCQRSFARALCARALSAQLDLEPARVFLPALLADIGEQLLFGALGDHQHEFGVLSDALIYELVAELHPHVGVHVLSRWDFSQDHLDVARAHHADPEHARAMGPAVFATVVAERAVEAVSAGQATDDVFALEGLEIERRVLDAIVGVARAAWGR